MLYSRFFIAIRLSVELLNPSLAHIGLLHRAMQRHANSNPQLRRRFISHFRRERISHGHEKQLSYLHHSIFYTQLCLHPRNGKHIDREQSKPKSRHLGPRNPSNPQSLVYILFLSYNGHLHPISSPTWLLKIEFIRLRIWILGWDPPLLDHRIEFNEKTTITANREFYKSG